MTDDRKRIAEFVEAARSGGWTRRQTRNAIYHFKLRGHRDAIFAAFGYTMIGAADPNEVPNILESYVE
ncbi:MAG: hypothetical protein Tsb009_33820 [Planctomycetaceae bacterium]